MNLWILLQVDQLSPVQRAVREHFEEGGSIPLMAAVLLSITAAVYLVYLLMRRQERAEGHGGFNDPHCLFQDLLEELHVPTTQRRLLESVAKDLSLKHPSTILLSPTLFDQLVGQWEANQLQTGAFADQSPSAALIADTRAVLFPES